MGWGRRSMGNGAKATFLVAAYNRRELTVRALSKAFESARAAGLTPHAVLFDDASTDGTAAAVTETLGESVTVIRGRGSAFWASSMAQSELHALKADPQPDFLVWLNDDVEADLDAMSRLTELAASYPERILVASTRDPENGALTYGGMARSGIHPLAFSLVKPDTRAVVEVDAMNGNLVLVPRSTAERMGGIDGAFSHALADIDYATRARRLGHGALLAPGTFGTCARNSPPESEGIWTGWRRFTGTKGGGNPSSTARILRRLAPRTWPLWWASSYILWWTRAMMRATRTARTTLTTTGSPPSNFHV